MTDKSLIETTIVVNFEPYNLLSKLFRLDYAKSFPLSLDRSDSRFVEFFTSRMKSSQNHITFFRRRTKLSLFSGWKMEIFYFVKQISLRSQWDEVERNCNERFLIERRYSVKDFSPKLGTQNKPAAGMICLQVVFFICQQMWQIISHICGRRSVTSAMTDYCPPTLLFSFTFSLTSHALSSYT